MNYIPQKTYELLNHNNQKEVSDNYKNHTLTAVYVRTDKGVILKAPSKFKINPALEYALRLK